MTPMKRALLPLACALLLHPLARADDAPRCTYVEVADMPLKYAGPNLVPAVDGIIDGAPAVMLVDTGAFDTSLTMNAVLKRDLIMHMTGRYVEGIGGSSRLYGARIGEFAIGPVKSVRKRLELFVIGETTFTPAFDALVGAPFLLQADMEFDLRAKHMKFFRPLNCNRDSMLSYWKEDAVAVPFEFTRSTSPNPHFKVVVNGKELDAIIDTGAHDSFLTKQGAERLGIDLKSAAVKRHGYSGGIGSDRAANWTTPVKTVQIGGETIQDGELRIVDVQGMVDADLFLGQDFLRAHRVLFAMSQRKLYFAYLGGEMHSRAATAWSRGYSRRPKAAMPMPSTRWRPATTPAAACRATRSRPGPGWRKPARPASRMPTSRWAASSMMAGKLDEAIPRLRTALDQLPAERLGTLWLYNARVRKGDAALAKTELEASLKRQRNDDWPNRSPSSTSAKWMRRSCWQAPRRTSRPRTRAPAWPIQLHARMACGAW